jgi:hypothetical protein
MGLDDHYEVVVFIENDNRLLAVWYHIGWQCVGVNRGIAHVDAAQARLKTSK